MKEDSNNKHVCVLRTGKLFEHDIASNALKDNGIPFYKQMETATGLRLAMPFQPAMGPGVYYNILVPMNFIDDAKQLLNELPIDVTTEPDIWHFGVLEKEKRGWKIYAWFILAITVIVYIVHFFR